MGSISSKTGATRSVRHSDAAILRISQGTLRGTATDELVVGGWLPQLRRDDRPARAEPAHAALRGRLPARAVLLQGVPKAGVAGAPPGVQGGCRIRVGSHSTV